MQRSKAIDGMRQSGNFGSIATGSRERSDENNPALASDRNGRLLLVYERHLDMSRAVVSGQSLIAESGATRAEVKDVLVQGQTINVEK